MLDLASLNKKRSRWNSYLSSNPQDYKAYIQRGMINFQLARIEDSLADFNYAETLEQNITPYLWQRGLSYYYLERYEEGAKQFEIDLQVNSNDIEETIWRYLCLMRCQEETTANKCFNIVLKDHRQVMKEIYYFYTGKNSVEDLLLATNQGGNKENFYAHLYLGLFYEVQDESIKAQDYILKAVRDYPLEDYMWYLARVHHKLRGWENIK